ncbi:MAG: hypothetical protein M3417_00810 [Actinomycetota bacterium]|nr:hypothetical protein [Actinomycetota bacterium]
MTDDVVSRVLRAAGADAARVSSAAHGEGVARDIEEADLLATRKVLNSTPSFLRGPTGGELAPSTVTALTGSFFADALDGALAAAR